MRVYFLETVPGVAARDTVVDVQPGYARNFLFPRKLAVAVTPDLELRQKNKAEAEQRRTAKSNTNDEKIIAALNGRTIVLTERSSGTKLFGSITGVHLAKRVQELYIVTVQPDIFQLPHPIKTTGQHVVPLQLRSARGTITVEVRANA